MSRWRRVTAAIATAVAVIPVYVPQALAFPYRRAVGPVTVWSDRPIDPRIGVVIARADRLVAASPLATVPSGRQVFLTDGGWRWHWLALTSAGAFALTRPLSEAVVVNASDAAADRVTNGATVGDRRRLSGVLAHERTHTLIRARFGQIAAATMPSWMREGYPDYVAGESSLSDAEATALRQAGSTLPALAYHDARRRVAARLAANGGSVDRLFAEGRR